jgi:hypothetical protein
MLTQTRARVLKGTTQFPQRAQPVRAAHRIIRKGKAAKPTEFGEVVKIQEAEAFITDYEVGTTRVADGRRWSPVGAVPATAPNNCPAARRGWPSPTRALRRVRMSRRRWIETSHMSCCRGSDENNAPIEFVQHCDGAPVRKVASARSSVVRARSAAAIVDSRAWSDGSDSA